LIAGNARADVVVSANASRHFKAGVKELQTDDPDRDEKAYAEFRAAYADSPSWKILGNLGIIAQALERDGEAIDAYSRYLSEGGKELDASEREQVTEDLARLEVGHATVTLQTTPDGVTIIDQRIADGGKPIVNRYGPTNGPFELRLRPGHHRIVAQLDSETKANWEFDVEPGARARHSFELQRSDASNGPPPRTSQAPVADHLEPDSGNGTVSRVLGYSALGVGAVGIGAGIWFATRVSKAQSDGDTAYQTCSSAPPSSTRQFFCDRSQHFSAVEGHQRTAELISFSAAGAFVATGVLLLVFGPDSASAVEEASMTPWIGAGQLGLAGRF
jgi:hypothetical protein